MNNHLRPPTVLSKAIPFVLLAAFFSTLMIVLVKIAAEYYSIPMILFIRFLVSVIIILPLLPYNKEKQPLSAYLKTKRLPLQILRGIFSTISVLCYFYAAKFITLADATVLFNTSPFFIPLIGFFWGRIRIIKTLWIGIAVGFAGTLFILHPGKELFHPVAIIGLLSGFCAALAYVASRYLIYTEPHMRNLFYYFVFGTIISLILLITIPSNMNFKFDWLQILILLGIGVFSYLYQLFMTLGTKYAPVRLGTPLLYSSVIFSIFFDWYIWNIHPSMNSMIGISLIIIGAILLIVLYPKEDFVKRSPRKSKT